MKLKYNAPVILTFTLAATAVTAVASTLGPGLIENAFSIPGRGGDFRLLSIGGLRLLSHILGHAGWAHLLSNFTFILLIGPILEEKYGSGPMFFMMSVTAVVTGVLNVLLFPSGLLGASGIVFMLILLISITNIRAGEIPLTFILVVLLFLVKEVVAAFRENDISEFAHVVGGICGATFGFLFHSAADSDGDETSAV